MAILDQQAPPPADLAGLRAELDAIDDALQAQLMRRAEVVSRIADLNAKGPTPLRPGREAAIIRRLVGQHAGRLPAAALVRIWREILSAGSAIQRPPLIAICDPSVDGAFTAVAREQFGALTAVHIHRTPAQALGDVAGGIATAAVLPAPAEGEGPRNAWWTGLLSARSGEEKRPHVVGRLPFWAPRPEGAPRVEALVVSAAAPDPSGADRTLLALELPLEASRTRLGTALTAAGFLAGPVILRRDPGADFARALVDVDGFVTEGDRRLDHLGAVLRRPFILGSYAVPLEQTP